jgi:hypothetical protein
MTIAELKKYRLVGIVLKLAAIITAMYGVLFVFAQSQRYFRHLPKVKDEWRSVAAAEQNTISVGWNGRGEESSVLSVNLATGEWNGGTIWCYMPDGDATDGVGCVNFALSHDNTPPHLSLGQVAALKRWAETLPPSETNAPPEMLRLKIAVNLDGTRHVYQYMRPGMFTVLGSLSKLMDREFLLYLQ